MSITRSTNLDQIYISQFGLTNRVISDFLPDEFPKDSSHLFNNVSEGQKYHRIKCLSLIMAMMYIARLARPDILLAISHWPRNLNSRPTPTTKMHFDYCST